MHIPKKKCTKKTNQQAMVANLCGKKVYIHQDDEIRYVFTPTEQSYNGNLKKRLPFCFGLALERKRECGQTKLDW